MFDMFLRLDVNEQRVKSGIARSEGREFSLGNPKIVTVSRSFDPGEIRSFALQNIIDNARIMSMIPDVMVPKDSVRRASLSAISRCVLMDDNRAGKALGCVGGPVGVALSGFDA